MDITNTFETYMFRLTQILKNNNSSFLSRQLCTWFCKSTLKMEEKMQLVKIIPRKEEDLKKVVAILQANYDFALIERRNQEWLDFEAGKYKEENNNKVLLKSIPPKKYLLTA